MNQGCCDGGTAASSREVPDGLKALESVEPDKDLEWRVEGLSSAESDDCQSCGTDEGEGAKRWMDGKESDRQAGKKE